MPDRVEPERTMILPSSTLASPCPPNSVTFQFFRVLPSNSTISFGSVGFVVAPALEGRVVGAAACAASAIVQTKKAVKSRIGVLLPREYRGGRRGCQSRVRGDN